MIEALRIAVQGIKMAVDVYRALRAVFGGNPGADAEIATLDAELARALAELPGLQAAQQSELDGAVPR